MTERLEQAIAQLKTLPADKQDAIATLILEELEEEQQWDDSFARSPDLLAKLAAEAMNDTQSQREAWNRFLEWDKFRLNNSQQT